MSIVGTRPPLISETNLYEPRHKARLGNTARASLDVLLALYPDRRLTVKLKKYKDQHELFAERFSPEKSDNYKNVRFEYCDTFEEVIGGSDVIVSAATVFEDDVCADEYFKEGVLVVPIHTRGFTNCDLFFDKSCMASFVLKNTLSDNGGVTRGICKMDEQNNLTEVVETKNIVKTVTGAETEGKVIDVNSLVSMNMWGLTPDFPDVLEEGFKEFFEKEVPGNPLKAEYLIPIFIGELLEQGKMSVKVLKTNDTWYGMTYHEDIAAVKDSFKKMLADGMYKADLFSDL